jgi:hypothetical protein
LCGRDVIEDHAVGGGPEPFSAALTQGPANSLDRLPPAFAIELVTVPPDVKDCPRATAGTKSTSSGVLLFVLPRILPVFSIRFDSFFNPETDPHPGLIPNRPTAMLCERILKGLPRHDLC